MNAPHLVMLHGALGSADQFDILMSRLGDHFVCHAPRFSGHGGLPIPGEGFSTQMFMDDVSTFLDRKGIEQACFFGYSMGGYVALSLASRFPQRVKAVMTLAAKFDWNPGSAAKEAGMLIPDVMEKKVPAFTGQLARRHHPTGWKELVMETSTFMTRLGNHHPELEEFSRISCPVLLTVGDKDKMVTVDSTRETAERIPNGSYTILPGTPHPLEGCDMESLATEIITFFHFTASYGTT